MASPLNEKVESEATAPASVWIEDLNEARRGSIGSAEREPESNEGELGVKRDLSPRQVSMIALAGTIGTGMFCGPVGLFLAYFFMGCLIGGMILSLGEMTVFSPTIGGFVEMGTKYVDPALGFALGINYIVQVGIAVPAEMVAVSIIIEYWDKNTSHQAIYFTIVLVLLTLLNLIGVKYYGEVEFWFAMMKVTTIVGLIIFGIVINVGGGPNHQYIGGTYWREAPFNTSWNNIQPASWAGFLGFWAVLVQAAFSFGGIEGIAVLAGEARNPRSTMRSAVRTVFYRIAGLYILTVLMIGLNVPQNSPDLLGAIASGSGNASSSPFVVICNIAGVKVLPDIINAVVMTSAFSAGNEDVYASSRTLLAMAREALASLLCWTSICIAYIRFHHATKVQGLDRSKFQLRGWFQPIPAYICALSFSVIILFNGFTSFIPTFNYQNFLAAYLTVPIFFVAFFGWKIFSKSKFVDLESVDLSVGFDEPKYGHNFQSMPEVEVPVSKQV